ncbi:hypothetical protein J6590_072538 [Homalodisca vitripennis]|nr:hypothetical protein J6590_072538 [Homalodisca vitripennis]
MDRSQLCEETHFYMEMAARCSRWWLLVVGLAVAASGDGCGRVYRELRYPCRCYELQEGDLALNCDRVVFPGDFPALPYRAPVVSFSQRWVGHQNLPTQAFAQAGEFSFLTDTFVFAK